MFNVDHRINCNRYYSLLPAHVLQRQKRQENIMQFITHIKDLALVMWNVIEVVGNVGPKAALSQ